MNKKLNKTAILLLILGAATVSKAQNWSLSGNNLNGVSTPKLGTTDLFDLKFFTNDQFRMNLTKTGWLGLNIEQPRGWMEVNYCPPPGISQTGSIVTLHKCNGNVTMATNFTPDFIGGAVTPIDTTLTGGVGEGSGSGSPFVIPINFATGNITNILSPLYGAESPMFWVRKQIPPGIWPGASGPDEFDTKFIVMPDGSCGINIAQPRAALDVRGSNAPNRPAAIFGSRALGTGYTDPATGLYQYYTQQIHLVPVLKTSGYNRITQQGDQGLFFTDGKGTSGANSQSALVIAPWAASGDSCVGGMRMDRNGNIEFRGNLTTTKVNIQTNWWCDFVFAPDYKLRSLQEVESFINANKHLPDMPSEAEVLENGIDVADMQALQQQKIEELTLYIIQLQKQMEAMKTELKLLKQ